MTFNRVIKASVAICMAAILMIAACGCEDLGEFEDVEDYYQSFEDVILINGTTGSSKEYGISEYFYNDDSRNEFLEKEDGSYAGVPYGEYVYMAIPFNSNIEMDTFSLFMKSHSTVTVYISFFIVENVPEKWKPISTNGDSDEDYDDPNPADSIGELTVQLTKDNWGSFSLDSFLVGGVTKQSIQITDDQYILLQFRNNSGVRKLNAETQEYVDPLSGQKLSTATFTMTNLLIRALENRPAETSQGGE